MLSMKWQVIALAIIVYCKLYLDVYVISEMTSNSVDYYCVLHALSRCEVFSEMASDNDYKYYVVDSLSRCVYHLWNGK